MKIKFLILSLLTSTLLLFTPVQVFSAEEFKSDVNVKYDIKTTGVTHVTYQISLENLVSDLYATSYSLFLKNINPENISASENGANLETEIAKEKDKIKIKVNFKESVVGKNKIRNFAISYDDRQIASQTGEVWEITIPKLSSENSFNSYNISLTVPKSFGEEAYISPSYLAKKTETEKTVYYFNKNALTKTGITAGFGQFQVFSFNLNYHLENPLPKNAKIDVAIPPDTALQKVFYNFFSREPENVYLDGDGNWLATFKLKLREKVDIEIKGYVQIFAGPRPFPSTNSEVLLANLKENNFWPVNNPLIQKYAALYKTPREVYDFVTSYLNYNFERIKPNASRLGALEALKSPQNAICTEYTDLFIALLRANKIPAREVQGFAYTENPKVQPLSLVSDVLHSWPEYWDGGRNAWIPVDPTWGSTTGGIDFYNKLDLRHFAFVMHGQDPLKPYPPGSYKLGASPQKDIFVNFDKLPPDLSESLNINFEHSNFFPLTKQKITVVLKNTGSTAFYALPVDIYFDKRKYKTEIVEVLPPKAVKELEIILPIGFWGQNYPSQITVTADKFEAAYHLNKNRIIIINLLVTLFSFLIILIIFLFKNRYFKISFLSKKNGR